MKELAVHARQIGNEMYPKVVSLLTDTPSKLPQQFHIVFRKRLKSRELRGIGELQGYVRGTTVYLDAEWLALNPASFDSIFLHEMTHVAQRYARSAPAHWTEGIADYVRCRFGCTNSPHCAECSNISPHYRAGYSCAAALLFYIEANYCSNVVRDLSIALRRGSYSDSFFIEATGKSLDQLWREFKQTPAYRPSADEAIAFWQSMGFTNGVTLKQLRATMKRQPGGALTLDAQEFVSDLLFSRQLPGFTNGEVGPSVLTIALPESAGKDRYPVSRTFDSRRDPAPVEYHYTVVRASRLSGWKLQRAWKSDRDGNIIGEFPIP